MISFTEIKNSESLSGIRDRFRGLDEEGQCELEMMLESFLGLSGEVDGVGATACFGTLLIRIADGGRYLFLYPIALEESANVSGALIALSEYARCELLPFRLTDIPREELGRLTSIFPHVDARAYEDDEDSFAAIVLNELDMLDHYPTVSHSDVSLEVLSDTYISEYARLCSDPVLNKYWGYDALADNPGADAELFMLIAERERECGVALSLAILKGGAFLGEAVIYDLDYLGSGEVGIRILPEHQGGGIGLTALDCAIECARKIGLKALRARVREENLPAVKMTGKRMAEQKREGGVVYFVLEI